VRDDHLSLVIRRPEPRGVRTPLAAGQTWASIGWQPSAMPAPDRKPTRVPRIRTAPQAITVLIRPFGHHNPAP